MKPWRLATSKLEQLFFASSVAMGLVDVRFIRPNEPAIRAATTRSPVASSVTVCPPMFVFRLVRPPRVERSLQHGLPTRSTSVLDAVQKPILKPDTCVGFLRVCLAVLMMIL